MHDVRQIDALPVRLTASAAECSALAKRFGLVAVQRLAAELSLEKDGTAVLAQGTISASIVQSCAISAEDLAVTINEPLKLRFVPATHRPASEELELDADDLDEIEFTGTSFDLGEAVAQSVLLAIDPFLEGPDADRVRRELLNNSEDSGPFAALGKLQKPQ